MKPELLQKVEAYILAQWLKTGNSPSILELIEEFDITPNDVEELIEDDDEPDYSDELIDVDEVSLIKPLQPGDEGYELGFST